MIEDIFRDINSSVQRILGSQEFADLKKTVQSSLREVEQTLTGPAAPLTPEQQARQDEMHRQQRVQQEAQAKRQEELRRQQQLRREELRRQQEDLRRQQQARQQERVRQQEEYRRQVSGAGRTMSASGREWIYSDGQKRSASPQSGAIVKKEDALPKIRRGGAIVQTVMGSICTAAAGSAAVKSLAHTLMNLTVGGIAATSLWGTLLGASLILLLTGVHKVKKTGRFRNYRSILRGREFCRISDLSSAVKVSGRRTVRDLEQMIEQKLLPEGYFDEQHSCIILNKETYQQYLTGRETARRRQLEADADPQVAAMQQTQEEGNRYIWRIREINADLPEEEISLQLDKLAAICQKILSYVETHSEKLSGIRKFMSYYLPTTLKLLEAYRELEHKKIDTADAVNTRAEIRRALDNIILAFENLYADLVKDDLMDLSADISVLETMLTSEGLMEETAPPDEPPILHV